MRCILITAIPTPFPLDTLNTSSSSLWPLPPLLLLLPLISLVLPAHSRVPYEGPHLYRKMAPSPQQPSNTDSSSARGGASWASPPSTLGSPIRLAWSCAGMPCKPVSAVATACPEDNTSWHSPTSSGSATLSAAYSFILPGACEA